MNKWCQDCGQFVRTVDCYCVKCGADLLWASTEEVMTRTKTCDYCKQGKCPTGQDICPQCEADILEIVGEDMEVALDTFPDLCPYCLVRVLHSLDEEECSVCRTAVAWGADPKDLSWDESDTAEYWAGQYRYEPAFIPSVAEELETIPAIR